MYPFHGVGKKMLKMVKSVANPPFIRDFVTPFTAIYVTNPAVYRSTYSESCRVYLGRSPVPLTAEGAGSMLADYFFDGVGSGVGGRG